MHGLRGVVVEGGLAVPGPSELFDSDGWVRVTRRRTNVLNAGSDFGGCCNFDAAGR